MSIAKECDSHKGSSLVELAEQLDDLIRDAACEGRAFHEVEPVWHEMIQRMGNLATGLFISLQGDGNLGETVTTEDAVVLHRSAEPVARPFQTVFGLFQITAYVYARGPKKKIELRPVDARMQLPGGYASYLFEEFSQDFCVEQAFDHSVEAFSWASRRVTDRLKPSQPLIVLMDGAPSQWDAVHELHADALRSETNRPLLHSAAYHTLNDIPKP